METRNGKFEGAKPKALFAANEGGDLLRTRKTLPIPQEQFPRQLFHQPFHFENPAHSVTAFGGKP
jgi:hypothetical protein